MKRIISLAILGLMAAALGCGPADYNGTVADPGIPDGLVTRGGGNPHDTTQFEWVDYDFIYSVFTDVLGVNPSNTADDPENQPLGYLEARKLQVGATDYSNPSPDQANTGMITAPGYKTLVFAGTSACGIAVEQRFSMLFPEGLDDLEPIYLLLLSRRPTPAEIQVHQETWQDLEQTWQDMLDYEAANPGTLTAKDIQKYQNALNSNSEATRRKAASVCGSLVSSLEFLTIN
jgi:hypothetical protein